MASFDDTDPCLSTEWKMLRCPGVVVYDDSTFPISSQQDAEWTALDDGQGPSSQEEEEGEEEEQDDCRHLQPSAIKLSIECVDNAYGRPGVIVQEDKTFPISSQEISGAIKCVNESTFSFKLSVQCSGPIQGGNKFTFSHQGANQKTASGDDPRSSVKPNASPNQEEQDTAMEWESTASQSLASNVAPSVSTTEEETPMEVD
ncbi:uncharacterized protein LOC143336430 isoform X2 [Chaetodon auriga]|uniref:uncharacterized protein LOC143336430 isoform X2 n=1 Tax=Chaetodon auriga TaxID=39042 RepID=UPI004032C506